VITISLRAPAAWASSVQLAISTWPSTLVLVDDGSAPPTIEAAVREVGGPTPWPSWPAPVATRARATIVGRSVMQPLRLSAWARRTALSVADDDERAALAAWDLQATEHAVQLPADVHASNAARKLVGSVASEFPRLDDLLLATSELAANSIVHGSGPVSLVVTVSSDAVVVELSDRSPMQLPTVVPLGGFAASGRGMAIINAIADHWGVTTRSATKTVWCEMHVDR
jgi:anti-sigma regulatory factor (Ser/Thr protein kinase)